MTLKHIYLVHGYQAYPEKHWFPWLRDTLARENVEVHLLSMPNAGHPDKNEWIDFLEENIHHFGADTLLIGHSLGCITILLFLQKVAKAFDGIILVAGFMEKLPEMPELDGFLEDEIDCSIIKKLASKRIVFGSPEDYIVPFRYTHTLAKNLDAQLISLHDKGHFMQDDGLLDFPQLLAEVHKI